jgi:hypothetical protein
VEIVETEKKGTGSSGKPEHHAAEGLKETRARLVWLDRQRRGEIGVKIPQLGEETRGLGQPDGLDTRREPMPVGDRAEYLGDKMIRERVLAGPGGRGQDKGSISEVSGELFHKAGLADAGLT